MKLIVGLGNPGPQYAATRHNAGFMVLERLAHRHGLGGAKTKFHAGVIETNLAGQRATLMQPTTYMNRSGLAVGEAARFYKLDPGDLMVVVDDAALPVGTIRIRPGGSSGGQKGLEDIRRTLGTDRYPRLRVGVGEPFAGDRRIRLTDYVLGPFTDEQRTALDPALDTACEALETWLTDGVDQAMNRYNTPKARETEGEGDRGTEQEPEARSRNPQL